MEITFDPLGPHISWCVFYGEEAVKACGMAKKDASEQVLQDSSIWLHCMKETSHIIFHTHHTSHMVHTQEDASYSMKHLQTTVGGGCMRGHTSLPSDEKDGKALLPVPFLVSVSAAVLCQSP